MSGISFEKAKQIQGYVMPLQRTVSKDDQQRTGCNTCQLRLAHHMQCGRGGFYVQGLAVCKLYEPRKPADTTSQEGV